MMVAIMCADSPVGERIEVAATFWKRFRGLMFRRHLPEGGGLLLQPCSSIHMCFMRMPLDILYLDACFRVLAVQQGLRPWALGAFVKGCRQVLELPAGTAQRCGVERGMTLKVGQPAVAGATEIEEKGNMHGYEKTGRCAEC